MEHGLFYGNVHHVPVRHRICPCPSVFQGIQVSARYPGAFDGVLAGSRHCICLCMEMDICRDGSGILNYFLTQLHIVKAPVSWLTTERGAMTALIITNIWRGVPFNMLLLATG